MKPDQERQELKQTNAAMPVNNQDNEVNLIDDDAIIDKMFTESPEDLKKYIKKVSRKLREPVMEQSSFVGWTEFKGKKQMMVLKDKERLMIRSFIKQDDVKIGDNIWMEPNGMVAVAPVGTVATGRVSSIKSVRENQVLLTGEHEERWVSWDKERLGEAKVGRRVSILSDWTIVSTWEDPSSIEVVNRPKERYTDIGGLNHVIHEIKKSIDHPRTHKEAYKAMGVVPPKGILLHGPPGTGKTLLAKATAGENDAAFYAVKVSDIFSKWVGESEARIREVFQKARDHQPAIVFFDEFDALGNSRGGNESNQVYNVVTAELLQQMDGIENRGDVVLIAATNQIELVDEAFKRPGRFDKIIEIPRPNRESGMQIAKIHMPSSIPYGDAREKVLEHVVDSAFNAGIDVSGAIISALCNEAKVCAIMRTNGKNTKMTCADIDEASKTILMRQ